MVPSQKVTRCCFVTEDHVSWRRGSLSYAMPLITLGSVGYNHAMDSSEIKTALDDAFDDPRPRPSRVADF
jgi:hypothetical protein